MSTDIVVLLLLAVDGLKYLGTLATKMQTTLLSPFSILFYLLDCICTQRKTYVTGLVDITVFIITCSSYCSVCPTLFLTPAACVTKVLVHTLKTYTYP